MCVEEVCFAHQMEDRQFRAAASDALRILLEVNRTRISNCCKISITLQIRSSDNERLSHLVYCETFRPTVACHSETITV
jgi:hypothetical protein